MSGGLGVETEKGAINFDVQNYANDIVAAMVDVCTMKNIDPPILVKIRNSLLNSSFKEIKTLACSQIRFFFSGAFPLS